MAATPDALGHDLDWLTLQIGSLYEHNDDGRIVRFNDPSAEDDGAPFLFFGKTRLGNLWRLRAGLDEDLTRDLARLAGAERAVPDLEAVPERLHAMRVRIEERHPVTHAFSGLAYRFDDVGGRAGSQARPLTPAEVSEAALAFPHLAGSLALRGPVFGILENGAPVSLAFCATTPGRGCEVGVETLAAYRGRGFAADAVDAWAAAMTRHGVVPLYSARLDNGASRAVARALELTPFASDWHFR